MSPSDEREIGRLAGAVEGLQAQFAAEHTDNLQAHRESLAALGVLSGEIADLREHGTRAATDLINDFAEFKEKQHEPLAVRVNSLERWRFLLVGAWLGLTIMATVAAFALKFWQDL